MIFVQILCFSNSTLARYSIRIIYNFIMHNKFFGSENNEIRWQIEVDSVKFSTKCRT